MEHVENVHLRSLGADEALACPLGEENFKGIVRFKNHAAFADRGVVLRRQFRSKPRTKLHVGDARDGVLSVGECH